MHGRLREMQPHPPEAPSRRAMLTRPAIYLLVGMTIALAGIALATSRLIERERSSLLDRFAEERRQQTDYAARRIEADLTDLGEDMLFAARLVQGADDVRDRRRELETLLTVVRNYYRIAVFDAAGRMTLVVTDPGAPREVVGGALDAALLEAARAALGAESGVVSVSRKPPADARGWYRAFATALPRRVEGATPGALVILVDTQRYFEPLRLLAAEPATRSLLVGPDGTALPALVEGRAEPLPLEHALVAATRALEPGHLRTQRVSDVEASRLQLDRDDAIAVLASIRAGGGAHPFTFTLVHSTSELREHVRAVVQRLVLAAIAVGACLLVGCVYLVVSFRRQGIMRERLLHASQLAQVHERAQKILDHVPTGMLTLSADARVTGANGALRARAPEAIPGATLEEAFASAPEATRARIRGLLDAACTSGQVRSIVVDRIALFGEPGHYSIHAVPLESVLDDTRAVLVLEDLTAVRSFESRLVQAEKLATVGMLAAGIAHEIGTPLGVARGRAEYLLEKIGAAHPQAASARAIVDQVDLVCRSIRQLLDFSRLRPTEIESVSLGSLSAHVAELLRIESERRKVALEIEVPASLPPLAADPDQLQQVIVNLVVNAFDACAEGKRVVLSAHLDGGSPGVMLLEVRDDGCGISESQVPRVFDPFFTTKKRGQGTGLGLTIAAHIVRSHGGQIDIASSPGAGTRVTIEWPLAGEGRHALAS